MNENKHSGPFAAWVQGYEGDTIVLRVFHDKDHVPVERIPVSECGKLGISESVIVDEVIDQDGSVHPHIHYEA